MFHKNKVSDTAASKLCWDPPSPVSTMSPKPESYVMHRLCLWMPRRAWNVTFQLSNLPPYTDVRKIDTVHIQSFLFVVNRSKGLYKKSLRKVVGPTILLLRSSTASNAIEHFGHGATRVSTSVAVTMLVIEF